MAQREIRDAEAQQELRAPMMCAAALCLVLVACGAHLAIVRLAPRLHLVKPNFLGKPVLASYGVISFAYVAAIVAILGIKGMAKTSEAVLYLWVMGAMCALGLLDDIFGSREVGGFKGHFRKLIFERRLTTGAVKAIGGGIVGIAAGWSVSNGDPARWITAALAIPLAANVLNLVDLRPGRATTVFLLGLGVTYILARGGPAAPWVVGTAAVVGLGWGIVDSRGRAMMGDSGSNSLGAALGLTIALNTSLLTQIGAILVFAWVHWYAEKCSISELIERNRVLRAIDRGLGVR